MKATITGQKWDSEDAAEQLSKVLKNLKGMSGLSTKTKLFKNIEECKKNKEYEKLTMDKGLEEYAGWENLPGLCLKLLVEYPYLYDLMKHDIMKWELHYHAEKKIKKMKDQYLGTFSAMVGMYV